MVKLPSFEWFMGLLNFHGKGNIYSGSIGVDPYYGDNSDNIFRYRVWIDKNEDEEYILIAGWYNGNKSYDETEKDLITEKNFNASADGISEAQQWIIDSYKS